MTTALLAPTPADVLARTADHPSAFLALNRETAHFTAPGIDGLIAYRASGGWFFQLGGPFASEAERAPLLAAFQTFARQQRRRVCALQLRSDDVALYRGAGFRLNQLGRSFGVDLRAFTLKGSRFMQLRNKVNRARRARIEVEELGTARDAAIAAQMEGLTADWLRSKGRWKKLLAFMIGELGGPNDALRRTFVARRGAELVAFITYVPAWGRHPGWLHDLCRRTPDAPPGVMELINTTAIERFQAEGAEHLHFGFTPFVGCGEEQDTVEGRSKVVSGLLAQLARRGGAIYPARSQADYKLKWAPHLIEPEYVAFQGRFRLGCLLRLLILTRSI